MAFETVIGEEAAHVRMAGEAARRRGRTVSRSNQSAPRNTPMIDGTGVASSVVDLDADAAVLRRRQQMIDDVEALLAAAASRPP